MVGKRIIEPGFSDCPVPGRSFRVTMAVIGGIALLQLAAWAIGMIRRGPGVPTPPPMQASIATVTVPPTLPMETQPASAPVSPEPVPAAVPAPVVSDVMVIDPSSEFFKAMRGPSGAAAPAAAPARR